MAKTLNVQKMIIEVKDGVLGAAVLLYQVNENGNISKVKSVSVKNALTASKVNSIIAEAQASAETSEGIQ